MNPPLIGITLDFQTEGTFSNEPHNALRERYFEWVAACDGLPLAIPNLIKLIPEYLNKIDGLIVPGGDFAFPKEWYVDGRSPYPASPRLEFDKAIINAALTQDIPLLGICAGMQIMGCLLGCKMTGNIHKYKKTQIDHHKGAPKDKYCHKVILENDSLLKNIVGKQEIQTNSRHQEAIVELSDQVSLAGMAEDGVIEALEIPSKKFAIGAQWHPEYFTKSGEPSFELGKRFVESIKM